MKGNEIRWRYPCPYGALRRLVYALLLTMAASAAPAAAKDVRILAFGDSLTAGYGLPPGQGFAPQLEAMLRRNGVRAFVTNAGVSGNTAAQGRARLEWTLDGLEAKPDLAIVALGANDMLRGLPPRPDPRRSRRDRHRAEATRDPGADRRNARRAQSRQPLRDGL